MFRHTKSRKSSKGFTLIEVLIVIGIIAILAAIVIVAINPARQFAQARNAQRQSNINTILNAVGQKIADNKGIFNAGGCPPITTSTSTIGGTIDLSCLVPTYIPSMPIDPSGTIDAYEISATSIGRIMVCAPLAKEPSIVGSDALCVVR